jgi:transposase
MSRRARRSFSESYKAEAVALVKKSGKSVGQLAKELDLTETSLRQWVENAKKASTVEPLVLSERAELEQLRKENTRLRMERDFAKKAAAFFAKEIK